MQLTRPFFFLCTSLLLSSYSYTAYSQSYYISDQYHVEIRTGNSMKHRIVEYIKSGSPVTLIEVSEDNSWAKIISSKGTEGWIQKQFITNIPVARHNLSKANRKISSLEKALQEEKIKSQKLKQQLLEQQNNQNKANKIFENTQTKYNELRKISENAVATDKLNQLLNKKLMLQKIKVESLATENAMLKNNQKIDGMVQGTIAVVCGVILALLLPRLIPKKRSNNW